MLEQKIEELTNFVNLALRELQNPPYNEERAALLAGGMATNHIGLKPLVLRI